MVFNALISIMMVFRADSSRSGFKILIAYYLPVAIENPSFVLENEPEPRVC